MPDLPWLAVLAGTVLAFVLGAGYYAVLGNPPAAARGEPAEPSSLSFVPVELVRCLLLAGTVVGLAAAADATTWWRGLLLGLVLWAGFPLVLWIGAIVHEKEPVRLAVIHGGDWLVKLLALGTLAGMWT
jgi:Protein of unknown function (DUF1761)